MSHVVAVVALSRAQSKDKGRKGRLGLRSVVGGQLGVDDGAVVAGLWLHGHSVTWHHPRCREKPAGLWLGEENGEKKQNS